MLSQSILLFKLWLKHPLRIGAVAPSSRDLADAMARLVPQQADGPMADGPVVELGGGTGVVTRALLEAGVAAERLVVVERDPTLHRLLCDQYPAVTVVQGDAANLVETLRPYGIDRACAVVSSLPILSMRKSVRRAIAEQSFALLAPKAPFIQFTYGLFSPLSRRELGLIGEVKDRILHNLPPASVWLYYRPDVFGAVPTAQPA
jgi:phosphatidylethanolamine/phosphatidyl-N-methylethanolamine N-methyltransferase